MKKYLKSFLTWESLARTVLFIALIVAGLWCLEISLATNPFRAFAGVLLLEAGGIVWWTWRIETKEEATTATASAVDVQTDRREVK